MVARRHNRTCTAGALLALSLCIPGLLGGCPEFRNSVVDSVQTATEGILVGGVEPPDAFDTAARGFVSATVELLFDTLRVEEGR